MATQIQEPQELQSGEITDQNSQYYDILVYKKDPNLAGLKTLNIGGWKQFLRFNENKADNIANFIGIDPLVYDISTPNPTVPTPPGTILDQVNNIADKVGINLSTPAPSDPTQTTNGRVGALENTVDGYEEGGSHVDGLVDKTSDLLTRVGNLESEVGSESGQGGDLFTRMGIAESNINTLQTDSGNLQTLVGTPDASSPIDPSNSRTVCKVVENNYNEIGTEPDDSVSPTLPGSGLKKRCKDIEIVNDIQAEYITELQDIVGTSGYDQSKGSVSQRLNTIENGMSSVYKYVGDIVACSYDNSGSGGTQRWYVDLTNRRQYFDEFGDDDNGNVYNINPTSGDSIVINNVSYTKGTNIAFVYDGSLSTELKGKFDELGTAIDVSRIDDLEDTVGTTPSSGLRGDVAELQDKFFTKDSGSSTWSSSSMEDGMYLVVGRKLNPVSLINTKIESFIGYFSNHGACYVRNDIHIESSDSIFAFNDSGGSPSYVVQASSNDVEVYITQIG